MKKISIFKKGDTIIEVLFAVSVFALVMVGGLMMMNSGLARSQASLQLTMARNAIDAQAESLRYMNSAYISAYTKDKIPSGTKVFDAWNMLTSDSFAKYSATNLNDCNINPSSHKQRVINIDNMTLSDQIRASETYPRLVYTVGDSQEDTNAINLGGRSFHHAEGVWIESVKGGGKNGEGRYYDFHIRACWRTSLTNAPVTLGTIVRLYDPR